MIDRNKAVKNDRKQWALTVAISLDVTHKRRCLGASEDIVSFIPRNIWKSWIVISGHISDDENGVSGYRSLLT